MKTLRTVKSIVVHHSATVDGDTFSWNAIRKYHTETNLWDDIGYHFGIERLGFAYECFVGRFPTYAGAHTKELGTNSHSIGVCVVGNYDDAAPPAGAWTKTVALVKWLMAVYRLPKEAVLGHREVGLLAGFDWRLGQYKSCPGRKFDMDKFRGAL